MSIWKKTAESAFEHTKNVKFVERNGLYDKLILAYSFKEDLEKKKSFNYDSEVEDFQPILTTNGICYTFNSIDSPNIWKPSKVTSTFNDMFPSKHVERYFGGIGSIQGKYVKISKF